MTYTWQRFLTQNPPEVARSCVSKTIQNSRGPPPVNQANMHDCLKLGVVKRSNSLYNSPISCIPKKQGQELLLCKTSESWTLDKYLMKEIMECIGNIGSANSSNFMMLDLTSRFCQMKLDNKSQELMAFTVPRKEQFHRITSPMGLLGCPTSLQWLMEGVLRDIPNGLI